MPVERDDLAAAAVTDNVSKKQRIATSPGVTIHWRSHISVQLVAPQLLQHIYPNSVSALALFWYSSVSFSFVSHLFPSGCVCGCVGVCVCVCVCPVLSVGVWVCVCVSDRSPSSPLAPGAAAQI